MLLLEFQSLDQEFVDVLGLLVSEIGTEVLDEFDDPVFAQILVCAEFESVVSCHA